MQTVEEHCEDRPRDMRPYRDADGNVYDFGFGLDWRGIICDERTERYVLLYGIKKKGRGFTATPSTNLNNQ